MSTDASSPTDSPEPTAAAQLAPADTTGQAAAAVDAAPVTRAASAHRKRVDLAGNVIATGRRKTAVARVRLRSGSGVVTVNSRPLEVYFSTVKDRELVAGALSHVGRQQLVDVDITVSGGGPTGQAGACRLGIARALKDFDGELAEPLRQGGLLTRDGRMKERKKYGLRGARRGTQFSKR
jgi:small subunit ribosomal protein S9